MKKNVHPKYNAKTVVICDSCANTFVSGSTLEEIRVEICYNCHPFYTGKAKIVDTENLVKKFEERRKLTNTSKTIAKKQKIATRSRKTSEIKADAGLTLRDMLKQVG